MWRRLLWLIPVGWLVFCLVVSVDLMLDALARNPDGAYRDAETGAIRWLDWLGLGLGWFLLIALPPVTLASMIIHAINRRVESNR